MKIYGLTDTGVVRSENQDNYWGSRLEVEGSEVGVVCLCDGMGGLKNGAEASRTVVQNVRDYLVNRFDIEGVADVVRSSNDEIYNRNIGGGISGTTCTLLICKDYHYTVFHIGDSRCYLFGEKGSKLLTKDHTVVEKYRSEGASDEVLEKVKVKYRNMLTRCLGVKEGVVLDLVEGSYNTGDTFLVCSDGFWHGFKEPDFYRGALGDLSSFKDYLIRCGETDNITGVLLGV